MKRIYKSGIENFAEGEKTSGLTKFLLQAIMCVVNIYQYCILFKYLLKGENFDESEVVLVDKNQKFEVFQFSR